MMIRSRTLSLALLSLTMVVSVPAPAAAAPRVTSTIDVGNFPQSVAFSPNGKKAYVANGGGGVENDTVSVITVATGDVTDTIDVGNNPTSVAFSRNGKKAYVANYLDDTVSVIKTR
jgi:YVTN family beta-propeller protein